MGRKLRRAIVFNQTFIIWRVVLILLYRKIGPQEEGNEGAARDFPRTQPIYLYLASTDILLICNA